MCLGIPVKVVSVEGSQGVAEFGSVRKAVDLRLIDHIQPGDYVVLHAGFAITRIDPEEAQRTLALMRELEEPELAAWETHREEAAP